MTELKPCPFCGGEAAVRWTSFFSAEARVECGQCGCRTMFCKSNTSEDARRLAEMLWNRRVGEHK